MHFRSFALTDTKSIERLIEPAATALGLDLVRVVMIGGKSDPTLQVMAERPDTRQLTIDDCADLSRAISDILDPLEEAGKDVIDGAYRLEVSSPGIDRPLTRRADFADWAGHEARIKFAAPVDAPVFDRVAAYCIQAPEHRRDQNSPMNPISGSRRWPKRCPRRPEGDRRRVRETDGHAHQILGRNDAAPQLRPVLERPQHLAET